MLLNFLVTWLMMLGEGLFFRVPGLMADFMYGWACGTSNKYIDLEKNTGYETGYETGVLKHWYETVYETGYETTVLERGYETRYETGVPKQGV